VQSLETLGLGARARLLVDVADELTKTHGGRVPSTELELRELPGVGDNVAQAVLCFGFGRRTVLLDAATTRLIQRFCGRTDTRRWQVRLDLYQLAGSPGPDATFNSALLDHGALVCQSEQPRCNECPVLERCVAQGGRAPAPQLLVSEEVMNAA
jgi:A/G-specific adenine glycosylase